MMELIFEFGRILLVCFLAEGLSVLLPLPIQPRFFQKVVICRLANDHFSAFFC